MNTDPFQGPVPAVKVIEKSKQLAKMVRYTKSHDDTRMKHELWIFVLQMIMVNGIPDATRIAG